MNALFALAIAVTAGADLAHELAEATRTYDQPRAEALASALATDPEPQEAILLARAWLLVAELRRMSFENLSEDDVKNRRALGEEIDAAADVGLVAADALADSSEKYRIRADLLGTKIRSRYRAGKYKQELNSAIENALALDPENGRAVLSKAKTYVLRPDADNESIESGLQLLEEALAGDASLEQARLLQAYAWERLGNLNQARAAYEQCLAGNSDCAPASDGLTRLGK